MRIPLSACGWARAILCGPATRWKCGDMTIRFGARVLLESARMVLPAGSRTALLGPNGCGKTTLVARIVARDPRVRIHPQARIGYLGQDALASLEADKSALDNAMALSEHPVDVARTVLARLNLRADRCT